MKKVTFLLATSFFYLTSCTTGKYTASREYDDVYYTKSDKVREANDVTSSAPQQNSVSAPDDYKSAQSGEKREAVGNDDSGNQRFDYNKQNDNIGNQSQPDYSTTQQLDGSTYVTNNYYNEDDYYDYAYSSRLRRFYHPCGWSYYDTYYTNSYWYDYNPYSWGVSIYLGYSWWHPNQMWTPQWGVTIGNSYPGYAYDPWYSPYHNGYGSGYNQGYQNGYVNGYYNGLYNGTFNPYYYNSYDSYSYYYGPRGRGSSLNTTGGPRNLSQLYSSSSHVHATAPQLNQAANEEQPFIKIKHYASPQNANESGGQNNVNIKDPKEIREGHSQFDSNTGPVKSIPNIKGDYLPVKGDHEIKDGMDNVITSPIKVPSDIRNNQNMESAPIKDATNIKVNHQMPTKDNNDIRDIRTVPDRENHNIKSNPSEEIIRNPGSGTPIRSSPNNHAPANHQENNSNEIIRNSHNEHQQPIKEQNNIYENAPVKAPQNHNTQESDIHPSEQPVRNQQNTRPQYKKERNSSEQKPQQQAPAVRQPRQSEPRNSNNDGNRNQNRPRH